MKEGISQSLTSLIEVSHQLKPKDHFTITNKDSAIDTLKNIERKIEKSSDMSSIKTFEVQKRGNKIPIQNHQETHQNEGGQRQSQYQLRNLHLEYGEHLLPVNSTEEKFKIDEKMSL